MKKHVWTTGLWRPLPPFWYSRGIAAAQWNPLNPVSDAKQQADGATLTLKNGTSEIGGLLRLDYPCDLRSRALLFPTRRQYVVIKKNWAAVAVHICRD